MLIGEALRKLRMLKGYDVEDAASRCQISSTQWHNIEWGKATPGSELLRQMCDSIEVSDVEYDAYFCNAAAATRRGIGE